MVNLFVAIIVSDIEELKHEGNIQETTNKAYYIISYGNIKSLISRFHDFEKQMYNKDICVHSLCFGNNGIEAKSNGCKGIKVSRNIQLQLNDIVRKRNPT